MELNLSHHFCAIPDCKDYGKKGLGNITTSTIFNKQRIQLLRCKTCNRRFSKRYNIVFSILRLDEKTITEILLGLAKGLSLGACARVKGVNKDTVQRELERARHHYNKLLTEQNLHLTECQMDELWAFIKNKSASITEADQTHPEWGKAWVWLPFDPITKSIIYVVFGQLTGKQARIYISRLVEKRSGPPPLFTSDELPHYKKVLVERYSTSISVLPKGKPGQPKKAIIQIYLELQYATVHKTRENGRVVKDEQRFVFGKEHDISSKLEKLPVSQSIGMSFVERNNLTLRQHSRRLTRKTNGFSKVLRNLEAQVILVAAYYNFVLSHFSLKIKDNGECTPAMAAGITDHKWSMSKLLTYRIPDN